MFGCNLSFCVYSRCLSAGPAFIAFRHPTSTLYSQTESRRNGNGSMAAGGGSGRERQGCSPQSASCAMCTTNGSQHNSQKPTQHKTMPNIIYKTQQLPETLISLYLVCFISHAVVDLGHPFQFDDTRRIGSSPPYLLLSPV